MRHTIEWRRPDPVCATTSLFESGKGQAIHKRCHVNSNRDVEARVYSDGTTRPGRIRRRQTANDLIKGAMTKAEYKLYYQNKGVVKRTHERPSAELLERARKNSAKFDRRLF